MPRLAFQEIEDLLGYLGEATTYAKEARRIAKRVYGDEGEISCQLKYTYEALQKAVRIIES